MRRVVRRARHEYRRLLADRVDELLLGRSDDPSFAECFAKVWPQLRWDHRPSARRLWELASHGPGDGDIVEIGSFVGNSTIYLAAPNRDRVHAVDPHSPDSMTQVPGSADTSATFRANLERFGVLGRVEYHRMRSTQAAAQWTGPPVRLLFIDGLHTYEAVVSDYLAWQPHLAERHVVLFDDFLWPEVERAVRDLRRQFSPSWFAIRGGHAVFSTDPLSVRVAGLP